MKISDHQTVQSLDGCQPQIAGDALKCTTGISVAVADHPLTGGQCRPDRIAQVRPARRVHQQQFSHVVPFFGRSVNQQAAYFFGGRGTARFASQHGGQSGIVERANQPSRLYTLARTVDTVDDDHSIELRFAHRRCLLPAYRYLRLFN